MPARNFACVPNGIVPEEWQSVAEAPRSHAEALERIRRDHPFVVGYVGGHGLSNALDNLVEAGSGARMKDIGIVCVGEGPEKKRLQEKARALGSNAWFLPPVPKESVPGLLRLFDALYIGWARSPLYRFGISSNKLFEYMMAGIPIVHAVDAANDPVQEARCGVSVAPDDASAAQDSILQLASMPPEERERMGDSGRRYVQTHHNIGILAPLFLDYVLEPAD